MNKEHQSRRVSRGAWPAVNPFPGPSKGYSGVHSSPHPHTNKNHTEPHGFSLPQFPTSAFSVPQPVYGTGSRSCAERTGLGFPILVKDLGAQGLGSG